MKKSTLRSISNAMKKALLFVRCRQELLFIMVISIIIRIPRVPGILGNDAFIALFMGKILSEGYIVNWTLSPFSISRFFSIVFLTVVYIIGRKRTGLKS